MTYHKPWQRAIQSEGTILAVRISLHDQCFVKAKIDSGPIDALIASKHSHVIEKEEWRALQY